MQVIWPVSSTPEVRHRSPSWNTTGSLPSSSFSLGTPGSKEKQHNTTPRRVGSPGATPSAAAPAEETWSGCSGSEPQEGAAGPGRGGRGASTSHLLHRLPLVSRQRLSQDSLKQNSVQTAQFRKGNKTSPRLFLLIDFIAQWNPPSTSI